MLPADNRPLTLLFTDIEGSTRLWEEHQAAMEAALERHDHLLRAIIEEHGGHVFKTVGDGVCAAFDLPIAALKAATDIHRTLRDEEWGEVGSVRVRAAVHAGSVQQREHDYFGPPLNRVARLLSAGHGQQTLVSQAAFGLVHEQLLPGYALRDMGERRLKDLTRPEHVYQLVTADLPSEFPPLRTLDVRPNNLPSQATALIGREKEIASALALLRNPSVQLVTFVGPGGIGKTHLALQVAADLIDDFQHGVFFVDLAPITDPSLVLSSIGKALGVMEMEIAGSQPSITGRVSEYLRDKEMLLVLDNFEQVADASPELSALLRSAASVKMLVTSRAALRLYGEHEFDVPPLSLPAPGLRLPVNELAEYEAVRLFVERAQAVKPAFGLTAANAPQVAAICRRLDGLPLAIELAAARVRLLSPGDLLARLQTSLALLSGGPRDLPARQRTLSAAIQWSYDLLNDAERLLFRRMAVFKGGRTLEALEAVCGMRNAECGMRNEHAPNIPHSAFGIPHSLDVLEGTDSLLARSLLQAREGSNGEARYWMLETIHDFARSKLEESGEAEELRRRHAAYFCGVAESGLKALEGGVRSEWLSRLEDEHDNMRVALEWAAEAGTRGDYEPGLRLVRALSRFWFLHGHFSEGRRWLDTMLSLFPCPDPGRNPGLALLYARALSGKGIIDEQLGEYASATACLQQAISIFRELVEDRDLGTNLYNLGSVFFDQGNTAQARAHYEQSLAVSRETGDKEWTGPLLAGLGVAAYEQGDYAGARTFFQELLSLGRERDDRYLVATTLNNLGCVSMVQENYEAASAYLNESLLMLRELGIKQDIAHTLNNLAIIAGRRGEMEEARSLCLESLQMRNEVGERLGMAESLGTMAWLLSRLPLTEGSQEQAKAMERAAMLWGAAAGLRDSMGAALPAEERGLYEEGHARARTLLGSATLDACETVGRSMSLLQAIEKASLAISG